MADYGQHLRPVVRLPLVIDVATSGDTERAALALRMFVALVSGDTGGPDTHEAQVLEVLRDLRKLVVGGAVYPEQRRRVTEQPKPSSYLPFMDAIQTLSGAPHPEQLLTDEAAAEREQRETEQRQRRHGIYGNTTDQEETER